MVSNTKPYPNIGDKAPDFNLTSLEGRSVSLSGYRGRKVVVFMWASW